MMYLGSFNYKPVIYIYFLPYATIYSIIALYLVSLLGAENKTIMALLSWNLYSMGGNTACKSHSK